MNSLAQEIIYKQIEKNLERNDIKEKIRYFQKQMEIQICAEIPTAFWERKRHIFTLPYEPDFDERMIPTKARPIAMGPRYLQLCKTEISELLKRGSIIPIDRAIQFADKFPNEIRDKTQLQRFLGSLNYIAEFYKNLAYDAKPLFDRLRSNPPEWTSIHTEAKFLIRVDCQAAKGILEKDVKNLASKQIFARWQAILSIFDFHIEIIKGQANSLPDFLTREFLQGHETTK
ncbi:hypothetical protein LINPERPRIM_LOCUS169 [Linum perenne]